MIKNVWDRHCRECNSQNVYVVLQETMTMVDPNKHVRLHKNNQPFSLMWINLIDYPKGTKRQQQY
jgi:hypothetical protein